MGETLTFTVGIYKKLWNLFSAAGQGRLRALFRTVVMEASRSCKVSILGVVTLEDIAGIFPQICAMYPYLKNFCYQNN